MTTISKNLIWASLFILLALANYFSLIADKDAITMFAILPALWVAGTGLGRCAMPWAKG